MEEPGFGPDLFNARPRSSALRSLTLRDCAAVGFRHTKLVVASFFVVFAGAIVVTSLMPTRYDAHLKILVKKERFNQVVSPDQNTQVLAQDTTETDVNSEVEILKSRDLLAKVVAEMDLASRVKPSRVRMVLERLGGWPRVRMVLERSGWRPGVSETSAERRTLSALDGLERSLRVEPLKKTKLIEVSYASGDPKLASAVLHSLVALYLDKHLAIHRLPGALDFFQSQTQEYQADLSNAQQKLVAFGSKTGVVAAPLEKEMTVRRLDDLHAQLQQTGAAIAETEQRIKVLEQQAATTPARLTTQVKTTDNPMLLQQMKTTLLSLELKRTEMLGKFAPDYRPVQEIEAEIAQAREALENAEKSPVREEITDRDAAHEWMLGELAKARTELIAQQARAETTSRIIVRYEEQARRLNEKEVFEQNLVRSAKTAEDNFLLYSRKQEEARISDALDQQRIVNVSLAEEPTVPSVPSSPKWPLNLMIGFMLACFISVAAAVLIDQLDRSFRAPDEVEAILNIPVLASFPMVALSGGSRSQDLWSSSLGAHNVGRKEIRTARVAK